MTSDAAVASEVGAPHRQSQPETLAPGIAAIALEPRASQEETAIETVIPELSDPNGPGGLTRDRLVALASTRGIPRSLQRVIDRHRSLPLGAVGTAAGVPVPGGPVDTRSSEEIARTREIHQSRRLLGMDDLPALRANLGASPAANHAQRQRAQSYAPRLEQAQAEIALFVRQGANTAAGQASLSSFRAAARAIEADLEEDHILDSPDTRVVTSDYNQIMEALRTLFRRIPSEPGHFQ